MTRRVGVVEDNADNRLLIEAMLAGNYQVDSYADGVKALVGMRAAPPDVVLMDISLPEMDGGEVLLEMRADPALCDIPVIAVTAHAMAGDRERYLAAGFDQYLSKPILDHSVLIGVIEEVLRGD